MSTRTISSDEVARLTRDREAADREHNPTLTPRHHPRPAAASRHAEVSDGGRRVPAHFDPLQRALSRAREAAARRPRGLPAGDAPSNGLHTAGDVLNANVDKLNGLLFTHMDSAAIGERV